ncbi:MAG: hypothetical protein WDZ64_01630 [Parcubacteria group bacterium]
MSDTTHKPEKIASAIYLITSFFNDLEPLKWRLRSLSSEFVSLGIFVKDNIFSDRQSLSLEARSIVLEIMTLISVAKTAGLISDDNHRILREELLKYLEALGLPTGITEKDGHAILSSRFFDGSHNLGEPKSPEHSSETPTYESKPDNYIKDRIVERPQEPHRKELLPRFPSTDKRQAPTYGHRDETDKKSNNLKSFGAVSVKKNSRQSIIINILKRKKEIMIKDVSPLVNGCSEKTIQRELLAMVQAGILKKVGEKRWSRYSLA